MMKAFLFLLILLPPAATAYELHEWGTFTTVSGSDGVLLTGLEREEEVLPPFVHAHFGMENGGSFSQKEFFALREKYGSLWPFDPIAGISGKGLCNRPVTGVTVKMEMPVIYFHSDKAFRAKVDVGFKGGTISQWYPARSGGESLPLPEPPADPENHPLPASSWLIDFSKPYTGSISWDIEVLSPEESRRTLLFKARETLQWVRARVPEANAVRTGNENEGYLFYRGIGGFIPGLHVTVDPEETLHLRNLTAHPIPWLLVYEKQFGNFPTWKVIETGIDAEGTLTIPSRELIHAKDHREMMKEDPAFWVATETHGALSADLYHALKTGLTRTGLIESEADAMIRTWWDSYFEKEGLRVFWILPRPATDALLPLSADPAPAKTVRTIVGRSEILRPREEERLLKLSRMERKEEWVRLTRTHRFGLAIQERIKAIDSQKNNASTSKR